MYPVTARENNSRQKWNKANIKFLQRIQFEKQMIRMFLIGNFYNPEITPLIFINI